MSVENTPNPESSQRGARTERDLQPLRALLHRATQERATPGAQLWVGSLSDDGELMTEFELTEGRLSYEPDAPPVTHDTIYDLASLTKPLATATWVNILISEGKLDPKSSIGDWVDCGDASLARAPVWRLLNHSSGLPAHVEYFRGLSGARLAGTSPERCRQTVWRMIASTPTKVIPGERSIYSDLGYLLLERIAERAAGEPLLDFWRRVHPSGALHFCPLNARSSTALNTAQPLDPNTGSNSRQPLDPSTITPTQIYAPTEDCPWRSQVIRGEVHDDNAWLIGGVCGHAGLFGTARAVGQHAAEWLRAHRGLPTNLPLDPEITRWMLARERRAPQGGSFVLGWDTPSAGYSSSGQRFSGETVGHLGFTGTSLWIDLARGVIMVLLTNRVHPGRQRSECVKGIRWLRPQVHNAAWALLRE